MVTRNLRPTVSTRILARLILLLQNTVRIENVTLSRIVLRYYRDSVTVILTARSLQPYVISREVTVPNSFIEKKELCNGKTYKMYEKRAFRL